MLKITQLNKTALFFFTLLSGTTLALPLKHPIQEGSANFYISYYSPADVVTQVGYQLSKGINSTIIWDMSGDVNPASDQSHSLINAINQAAPNGYSIAYWSDWGIYPSSRALPFNAYFVPGALDDNGNKITNPDFDAKAKLLNAVVYSFLEVAPDGTIYFNDPWSDLAINDSWCQNGDNETCSYAFSAQGKAYSAHYGNFEAFAAYSSAPLDKFISVGGYGHDSSFEQILGDASKVNTFVETAYAILSHYHLTGIDLDYENPNMTGLQSQQFADLVEALNSKFSGTSFKIMVTTLANPAYLRGEKDGSYGFSAGVLSKISNLSQVQSLNLMTYDFYGAFNYTPDGSGRTGFLSDTYLPNNAPSGSVNFSAQESIEALVGLGVAAEKISGGIPTYGRALQAISASDGLSDPVTGVYSGLYASISSSAFIPRGDLDDISCNQAITPLSTHSCSGSFTYAYIVHTLIDSSFTVVDWANNSQKSYNGSTAYSPQYAPPIIKNYSLELTNTGSNYGFQISKIANGTVATGQLDWMAPQADKTYGNTTNPNIVAIQGANDLTVTWVDYAGNEHSNTCPTFSLTANQHIIINPDTFVCEIKTLA